MIDKDKALSFDIDGYYRQIEGYEQIDMPEVNPDILKHSKADKLSEDWANTWKSRMKNDKDADDGSPNE